MPKAILIVCEEICYGALGGAKEDNLPHRNKPEVYKITDTDLSPLPQWVSSQLQTARVRV